MINKIILGTVQFGLNYGINNNFGKPQETQVFEILDYAYNSGIRILDTADAYGNATEIIGKYNRLNESKKFLINTKFKNGNKDLKVQIYESLNSLSCDSIYTYFYHSFDDFINYKNLSKQLVDLKLEGKIHKIGLSIYSNEEFTAACQTDWIDVIQFPFNLLDNQCQRGNIITLAKNNGKELQARSVFLQGLFFMPLHSIPSKLDPLKKYLAQIDNISNFYGISKNDLALNYVLRNDNIDFTLIGVDSISQLQENIKSSQITLSNEIINKFNNIDVKEVELIYPKNWR